MFRTNRSQTSAQAGGNLALAPGGCPDCALDMWPPLATYPGVCRRRQRTTALFHPRRACVSRRIRPSCRPRVGS